MKKVKQIVKQTNLRRRKQIQKVVPPTEFESVLTA
jgi:hypothetical protein